MCVELRSSKCGSTQATRWQCKFLPAQLTTVSHTVMNVVHTIVDDGRLRPNFTLSCCEKHFVCQCHRQSRPMLEELNEIFGISSLNCNRDGLGIKGLMTDGQLRPKDNPHSQPPQWAESRNAWGWTCSWAICKRWCRSYQWEPEARPGFVWWCQQLCQPQIQRKCRWLIYKSKYRTMNRISHWRMTKIPDVTHISLLGIPTSVKVRPWSNVSPHLTLRPGVPVSELADFISSMVRVTAQCVASAIITAARNQPAPAWFGRHWAAVTGDQHGEKGGSDWETC